MTAHTIAAQAPEGVQIPLKRHTVELRLGSLAVGIDNIHYDVFLSPRFVAFSRKYILDLLRQTTNAAAFYGGDARSFRPPESTAFRKLLLDTLQASLTHAQFMKNVELDLLFRLAVLKHLTHEVSSQFASLVLECKDRIRSRGEHFERSEQAYVLRSRLAELQAGRRNTYREVGQHLYQMLSEIEDAALGKLRAALFGEQFAELYELFRNRLLFVEGGRDDLLCVQHYVLIGNFLRDPDRFETVEAAFLEFLGGTVRVAAQAEEVSAAARAATALNEQVLFMRRQVNALEEQRERVQGRLWAAGTFLTPWRRHGSSPGKTELDEVDERLDLLRTRLEELLPRHEEAKNRAAYLADQYQSSLGDYLYDPANLQRLFLAEAEDAAPDTGTVGARLLDAWVEYLEQRGLLESVLASYEVRNLYLDYCPPLHLQQLKRALIDPAERKQVDKILKHFTARQLSPRRIEETARAIRRYKREDLRNVARRFGEDFIRLRRDRRNYQRVAALMDQVNLIQAESTRELSRLNNSLYECLLPGEGRPAEDRVVSHAVIKADVRGSTRITQELLGRGLNPASHFSLNLHAPVKRLLERYGAVKVFLEGDAIILAIYETEANQAHQRVVAKACVLAREILNVSETYNGRVESSELPRLELGVGVAFQDSAPTFWVDSDSRIMISRAINLSDRLSSCSKVARRVLADHRSPFHLFLLESTMEGAAEEEAEELLLRYNMNGIELNEEGFRKLEQEVALRPVVKPFMLPWGEESVTLHVGEVPIGETLEQIVVRQGIVRRIRPNGTVGQPLTRAYYEVCTSAQVLQAVRDPAGAPRAS